MNKNKIQSLLVDLEETISSLRKELGSDIPSKETPSEGNKKINSKKKEKGVDLHRPIRSLYDSGFFKDGKNDLDVIQELQKRLMTAKKPLRSSVVNVLRKMVTDGQLARDFSNINKKNILLYKNVTP